MEDYIPNLMKHYREDVVPALKDHFGYDNVMEIPRLKKIILNMGVGDAKNEPQQLDRGLDELTTITGQKAVATKSKKAISNFGIRAGLPIGGRVTLRRVRMYEFLEKFIAIALPRVRDFGGVPDRSFDGSGNYSIGIKEQIIFPEIDYDNIDRVRGMDITIVTSAQTDEEAYELLRLLGMPFKRALESAQEAA